MKFYHAPKRILILFLLLKSLSLSSVEVRNVAFSQENIDQKTLASPHEI